MANRRKLQIDCRLYETTNNNRLKTGDPLTAYVYPAGAASGGISSGSGSITLTNILGRSSLEVGDDVYILDNSNVETGTGSYEITAIEENTNSEGTFSFTLNAGSSFLIQAGGRIVANRATVSPVPIYKYPVGTTEIPGSGSAIDVPSNGQIEGYVEVDAVDVYFTGDTIDNGWYLFDVPADIGEIGPLTVRTEVLAATATLNIEYDTGIVVLDTDTAAITDIEHCKAGRILVLVPGTGGLQLTTDNSQDDNSIYESSGRTIDLEEASAITLLGVEASSNTAYWVIVGAVNLSDVGLTDLSDVNIAGPDTNAVVQWDGTEFVASTGLGSPSNRMGFIYAQVLAAVSSGGFSASLGYGGSATKSITIPSGASDVQMVTTKDAQTIQDGVKVFYDDIFQLRDPASNRLARFDVGGVTIGATRVLTVPDESGTIALTSDVTGTLADLTDTAISSPDTGQTVVYDGSDWVNSREIGSSANGHVGYFNSTGGLRLTENLSGDTIDVTTVGGPLGSDKTLGIKSGFIDNDMLVTAIDNIKHVTVQFGASGDGAGGGQIGWGWLDRLVATNSTAGNGLMIFKSNYRCVLLGADINLMPVAGVGAAGDYTLQLYHGASLPTADTIPPGSSNAMLSTAIAMPAGGVTSYNTITSFADNEVDEGNYVYLSIASGSTAPGVDVVLEVSLRFWEQVL